MVNVNRGAAIAFFALAVESTAHLLSTVLDAEFLRCFGVAALEHARCIRLSPENV